MNVQRYLSVVETSAPLKFFDSITSTHKKILLVALAALSLLFVGLLAFRLFRSACQKKEVQNQQSVAHEGKIPSIGEPLIKQKAIENDNHEDQKVKEDVPIKSQDEQKKVTEDNRALDTPHAEHPSLTTNEEETLEADTTDNREAVDADRPQQLEMQSPVNEEGGNKKNDSVVTVTGVNISNCSTAELEFFQACRAGDLKFVCSQLDQNPAFLNREIEFVLSDGSVYCRVTPLFVAAMSRQKEVVEELLKRKAVIQLPGEPCDLFFWVCLSAEQDMMTALFTRNRSHLDQLLPSYLFKLYDQLLTCPVTHEVDEKQLIGSLTPRFMNYPLSPVHALVLSNRFCMHEISDQLLNLGPDQFSGMGLLNILEFKQSIKNLLANENCFGPMVRKIEENKVSEENDFEDAPLTQEELQSKVNFLKAAIAARLGDEETLRRLNESGAKLECTAYKVHPVFYAIAQEDITALRILKQMSPHFLSNFVTEHWRAFRGCKIPLQLASSLGKTKVLEFFRTECKISLAAPFQYYGPEAMTCESVAAANGQVKVLRYLKDECKFKSNQGFFSQPDVLNHKQFVNNIGNPDAFLFITPVLLATADDQAEVLEFYRSECGIDLACPIDQGTEKGKTLSFIAASRGILGSLHYFREDAEIDITEVIKSGPCEGLTPVSAAVEGGHVDVLKFLHQAGADFSAPVVTKSGEKMTLAMIAAKNGHVHVLRYLKEGRGIDLTEVVPGVELGGNAPACCAALYKREKVLSFLESECNVDIHAKIGSGPYNMMSFKEVCDHPAIQPPK